MSKEMTNQQFAASNALFMLACQPAKLVPTKRQASKWLNDKGKARRFKQEAQRELDAKSGE